MDTKSIMDSETFFPKTIYEKRDLGQERRCIIFNNITFEDISTNDELMHELNKIGITGVNKLMKDQSNSVKLVKAYCKDEETMVALLNSNISIKTEHIDLIITTVPNVKSTIQCEKCFGYSHKALECKNSKVCGKCGSSDHLEAACLIEEENFTCINCGENHHAKDRKKCKYYRIARRKDMEEAYRVHKNGGAGKSNVVGSEMEFRRVCSLQDEYATMSNRLNNLENRTKNEFTKAIEQNSASNFISNSRTQKETSKNRNPSSNHYSMSP